MIKKIDANEYGVVKYAITSVDELNRLPKKIAPSSQAILIENGLRVFVYGDGQWVEEVVDGDLSENMRSIVADYERSKIGYDGVKRGSLEERLKDDFQGIYDILNARDYCEYSGKELKVDNTWMGNQIDTRVEGRTLQNVLDEGMFDKFKPECWVATSQSSYWSFNNGYITVQSNPGNYVNVFSKVNKKIKPNTTYTIFLEVKENTLISETNDLMIILNDGTAFTEGLTAKNLFDVGIHVLKATTVSEINTTILLRTFIYNHVSGGSVTFRYMILEGDHTQTPLSELPYFEGIESVGERDIGKNLLDPSKFVETHTDNGSITIDDKQTIFINGDLSQKTIFKGLGINKQYTYLSIVDMEGTYSGGNLLFYSKDGTKLKETPFTKDEKYFCDLSHDIDRFDLYFPKGNCSFKLQLEEGQTATEYEPFGYKIKGKSCGKNLFDKNNAEIVPWYIPQGESNNKFVKASTLRGFTFKPKFNTNYVITKSYGIEDNCFRAYGSKEYPVLNGIGKHLAHGDGQGQISFNSGENKYITCMCYTIKTDENTELEEILKVFDTIQVEEGIDTIEYEPYQESTYSIHSPIPLRSLPSGVCDIYDFESGAIIQKVGKVVFDGSEGGWSTSPIAGNGFKRYLLKFSSYQAGRVEAKPMCSINDKIFNRTTEGHGDYEYLYIQYSDKSMEAYYQVLEDKASSVGDFKLWLQANPTTVYYELEEPIIHYLTPSQLKSFEGTTHVISENTLIPTTTTKILTSTYANVSNVNSTTYSLRRGVNDVAETSAIINETDVEQDDVLDITMCAIDELYSMLEPNLE